MNHQVIYAKTPAGDEAVRQSTRVVQRNLRMVLVQVDGKLNVTELADKIGNLRLVENALKELEEDGMIAPATEFSAWPKADISPANRSDQVSALSQFSTFGAKPSRAGDSKRPPVLPENHTSSGDPVLPPAGNGEASEAHAMPGSEKRPKGGTSWALKGLLIILLAGIALVLFFPYTYFTPRLEASASRFLGVPVSIGQVSLTFSPQARLQLERLAIGGEAGSSIMKVAISSPYSLLFGSDGNIGDVEIVGGVFAAQLLADHPMFGAPNAAEANRPGIRRIQLKDCQIVAGDAAVTDIQGEILLGAGGLVEKASLQAFERALKVDLAPSSSGIAMKIESAAWKPAGATFVFESLQATGLLQRDKLLIQNVDAIVLGGLLKGNWLLDWRNGLAMAGDATLSRIDARKMAIAFAPAMRLEGEMGGSLRWRGSGANWEGVWRNLEGTLSADIARGAIAGVDLGEAARRGQGAVVRAGSTRFDRLRANVTINRDQLTGRDVLLESGMMSATGQFSASGKQIEAMMNVAIKTSVSSFLVPVRVAGVLPDLTAFGGTK